MSEKDKQFGLDKIINFGINKLEENSTPFGGKNPQMFTFGIHGTENNAANVREVATQIALKSGDIGKDGNMLDTFFQWQKNAGLLNGTKERKEAADEFARYAVASIVDAVKLGEIDPKKALGINLVGFSHGGNVAILATEGIAKGLKENPLTKDMAVGVHLTTLSTPAYNSGPESPSSAMKGAGKYNVVVKHSHFHNKGDFVSLPAMSNSDYDTRTTANYPLPGRSLNLLANHGTTQDLKEDIDFISGTVHGRNQDFGAKRADLGRDNAIASTTNEMHSDRTQAQIDKIASKSPTVDASLLSEQNGAVYKNDIYKNDGAPLQVDKQQLQAATAAAPSPTLVEGNEAINKLFKQAMSGVENTNIPNKPDAAALAVQTISQAPGFDPQKDISVMEGKKGLIVSQGQGPAGVNMLVPEAAPGDLKKVSEEMTRSQPQLTQTPAVVAHELEQKQSVRSV
jgi:hypothetical protein